MVIPYTENWTKEKHKISRMKWRIKHPDYHREYYKRNARELAVKTKKYCQKNREKIQESKHRYYLLNKKKIIARSCKWQKENAARIKLRNKEKIKARNIIHHGIRKGEIKKYPCVKCGNINSHAHHPNYLKPLNIQWLCSFHHGEAHRLMNLHPGK